MPSLRRLLRRQPRRSFSMPCSFLQRSHSAAGHEAQCPPIHHHAPRLHERPDHRALRATLALRYTSPQRNGRE